MIKNLPAPNILVELPLPGIIKISGVDAKKFLQGQLTCNLEEINSEQSRLGAHCNPQGRIISLFHLFQIKDDYYLYLPRSMVDIALRALKKYAVFYKIQLNDVGELFACFEYLSQTDNLSLLGFTTQLGEVNSVQHEAGWFIIKLATQRYLLIGQSHSSLTKNESVHLCSDSSLAMFNIFSGQVNIYSATSEKLLPHDINLHKINGISFNKGCYTGQEIIARMHYKGKLKNHLYSLKVKHQDPLLLGSEITEAKKNIPVTIVEVFNEDAQHSQLLVVAPHLDITNQTFFLDANNQQVDLLAASQLSN